MRSSRIRHHQLSIIACAMTSLFATGWGEAQSASRALARSDYGRGVAALAVKGDISSAYLFFARAAKRDSSYLPALFGAGALASQLGQRLEARKYWRRYLRIDSTSKYSSEVRLRLGGEASRPHEADPKPSYESLVNSARASMRLGRDDLAAKDLEIALREDSTGWQAPFLLAQVLVRRGRSSEAVRPLEISWWLAPDSLRPQIRLILYNVQKRATLKE